MSWKKILLEGDAAVLSDTVPGTIGENDTASAGVATQASRQDHTHGSPATWAPTAHDLDTHNSVTVAELSAIVSDATLDDSSDTRTPSAHLLDSHTAPTAAVDFNKQQATNLALDVQATAPATPVDGQVYFSSADDHAYLYVAA